MSAQLASRLFRVMIGVSLILVGCEEYELPMDPSDGAGRSGSPLFSISDGAHEGNDRFYFLPPVVGSPATTGQFDATVLDDLTVEICEWSGAACSSIIVTFTSSTGTGSSVLRLDEAAEQYSVNWRTQDYELDVSLTYRIRVLLSGIELGHADVDLVESGRELKNVDTGEYIALKDGGVLPINFRVEVFEGITIDATALSVKSYSISGVGSQPTASIGNFRFIPGSKDFQSAEISFVFQIISDGSLDYDPALDPQVTGRGTNTLTVVP